MKQLFLFGLTGVVLAAGCKKDNGGGSPTSATKYLERAVTTEDGQSVTYHLTYDSKNRLIAYNSTDDNYRNKVTYDNNGNPVKFELESEGAKQVFDIAYNNAGVPLRATSRLFDLETPGDVLQTQITYEAADGKINKMHFVDEVGNEATYTLSYVGNNLTKVVYAAEDGQLILTWKYGNKKSPYSAARFKYLVIPDLFSAFSSENEILEATLELTGIGSVTTKQTYEYDAAGYPISATEKDEEGNISSKTTFHYR